MITKKLGVVAGAAIVGFMFGLAFYAGSSWFPGLFEKEPVDLTGEGEIVRPLENEVSVPEPSDKVEPAPAEITGADSEAMIPVAKNDPNPAIESVVEPEPADETPVSEPAESERISREPSNREVVFQAEDNDPEPIAKVVSEEDSDLRSVQSMAQAKLSEISSTPGDGGTSPTGPRVTSVPGPVNVARSEIAVGTEGNPIAATPLTSVETPVTTAPSQVPQPTWYSNALAGSVSGLIGGMSQTTPSSGPVSFDANTTGRVILRPNRAISTSPTVPVQRVESDTDAPGESQSPPPVSTSLIQTSSPGVIGGTRSISSNPVNNGTITPSSGSGNTVIPGKVDGLDLGIPPRIGIRVQ